MTEKEALDLAAWCLRQVINEGEFAWKCVLAQSFPNVLGQLGAKRVIAVMTRVQHNECSNDLASLLIRQANHRALGHSLVFEQRAFDIERSNPVARGRDHIIAPANKAD